MVPSLSTSDCDYVSVSSEHSVSRSWAATGPILTLSVCIPQSSLIFPHRQAWKSSIHDWNLVFTDLTLNGSVFD